MNKLIKISENEDGKQLVSARDLYLGLGLNKSEWSKWYKRNIESNDYFAKEKDWTGFGVMTNGNETMDFAISLEFAK
ncbi:MAG: antA/AntB antirepressor family protein, partial [Clostridium sp.]